MKYSVVVPVYNSENYLRRCLDSVFAYPGDDLEVIALDDGSTDGSLNVLRSYPDRRLKVIAKENEGAFKTWKRGVELATGEYIVFVDSDDYVSAELFPSLNAVLGERDYDLVQFGWTLFCGSWHSKVDDPYPGCKHGAYTGKDLDEFKRENVLVRDISALRKMTRSRWGKAFRAEKLKALLPRLMESIKMFEDDSVTIPFMLGMESLYLLPKSLYYYWIDRVGSVCNSPEKFEEYLQDAKAISSYLESPQFALPAETLDCYYFHYHMDVLVHVVHAKNERLAQTILSDARFSQLLKERKEFKFRLLYQKRFKTYRLLKKVKNLFMK